ncbi:acetylxylan esterase [Methylomicrobium agile]|uniref:acetylxylan esterase n=1 Tax=Methylomicrobium agile TaxID=39774 RepID=UPI0004DECF8C|nr:acetylxylan esterase [Methylomicrobium agile]
MPDFDPSYGYSLDQLLRIMPPLPPDDFASFWEERYRRALALDPRQRLRPCGWPHPDFECCDLYYRSTDDFDIRGWALIPKHQPVERGVIVGHGYGGREGPDFHLPIPNAVLLFPCFRGLSRSRRWPISDNPAYHVLHDIDRKDRYILGGCVEDLWLAVSALLALFPGVEGRVGYLGISFGGGIGALAMPWDGRIRRAHFNVPSFGDHPLRLKLPTWGSAAAVQNYQRDHDGHVLETLRYYDAAVAARYIRAPAHVAAALADPVVAPPGQFSIYNALAGEKRLFVLDWGHADYPDKAMQENALIAELGEFFGNL